jgi:hypothetical protein
MKQITVVKNGFTHMLFRLAAHLFAVVCMNTRLQPSCVAGKVRGFAAANISDEKELERLACRAVCLQTDRTQRRPTPAPEPEGGSHNKIIFWKTIK